MTLEGKGVYDRSCNPVENGLTQCDAGIQTEKGFKIKARHVVVATNAPVNKNSLYIKQAAYRTYVIATLIQGASCNSSGTHLHFTVSRDGVAQNPFNFLKGGISHENRSGGDPFNPSGSWEWPIDPTIEFNQGYGDTWYVRTYRFYPTHNGIDISGSSTVKAVKSGTLFKGSYAGYQGCTLPYVRVHHNDDGLDTFYLHVY